MRMILLPLLLAIAMLVQSAGPAPAQSDDELAKLRKEIEALKEGQRALQRDLEDIKGLLRSRGAPPAAQSDTLPQPVAISIDDAPFLGSKGARVAVVEFSDYQCPFCARHSQQTLPALVKEYVDAGKIKYVMRDFPIAALHPDAQRSHEAAHCAGEQGKYWPMHHRLFGDLKGQQAAQLAGHARALNLDVARFESCVSSDRHSARVKKAIDDGQKAGVRGTPTFFVGVSAGPGSVQATRIIRGAQPLDRFRATIDSVLADVK